MTDIIAWVIFLFLLVAALAFPAVLVWFAIMWTVGAVRDWLDR